MCPKTHCKFIQIFVAAQFFPEELLLLISIQRQKYKKNFAEIKEKMLIFADGKC